MLAAFVVSIVALAASPETSPAVTMALPRIPELL
jgi:hypothetical protein